MVTKTAQHFSNKGRPKAIEFLGTLAEMIDVPQSSIKSVIMRHLHSVQPERNQELNTEMATKCTQHFSSKGKPKAIQFLGTLEKHLNKLN